MYSDHIMAVQQSRQVRQYTLQTLAGDTALLAPREEAFSRRGGLKLVRVYDHSAHKERPVECWH